MRMITVSSKNQITIPVAMLREVGIHPGDRMAAAVIDGDIVLIKEPESWVQYFQGSARGAYGGSVESIDRYVAEERSWYDATPEPTSQPDPREWLKKFEDLYATDSGVRAITDILMGCPYHVATYPDLEEQVAGKAAPAGLTQTLYTLTSNSWVRRILGRAQEPERYRLDGEIAASLRAA